MLFEITLSLAFIAVFVFLILKLRFFSAITHNRHILVLVFLLKMMAAVAGTLLYTHYYDPWTADMYKYFHGGKVLYSALPESPSDYFSMVSGIGANSEHLHRYYDAADYWYKDFNYGLYNDNRTMIRYNALLCLLSQGKFYVNLVISVFISFLGSVLMLSALLSVLKKHRVLVFMAVFLMPSVLFWSSGLLKEGLVIFTMGGIIWAAFRLKQKACAGNVFWLLVFAALLFLVKFYVLLAVLPGLLFLILPHTASYVRQSLSMAAILLGMLLLFFGSNRLGGPNLPLIISQKQHDFVKYVSLAQGGSNVYLPAIEPNVGGFVKNMPRAYYHSFLRPHPLEINSPLSLMATAENLFVLVLAILAVFYFRKPQRQEFGVFLFSISFVLILYALAGLTTPNLGALVRYKMPALIFAIIAAGMCINIHALPPPIRKIALAINDELK